MARIRAQRRVIALDMTAMCDMAFLLLTFFMLATKFKPPEVAAVNIPSSVSENKLPESDLIILSVEKSGAVFLGIEGETARKDFLDKVSSRYKINYTEKEKHAFGLIPSFGTSVSDLKLLLRSSKEDQKNMQRGIPADSANNELKELIKLAKWANPKSEIAIKADMELDYPVVETIIATLQDLEINKFKFVTSLETKRK
jgi:biopolymer transport protein ExbD